MSHLSYKVNHININFSIHLCKTTRHTFHLNDHSTNLRAINIKQRNSENNIELE